MEYKKLSLIVIAALALAVYVLPLNEWTSQVTAQSNDDESESENKGVTAEEEEKEDGGDEDKLKDGDPDANNGNGNDAKSDKEEDDDEDDEDGNQNNREGTPGTERCLERSNGNCAHSPVHDGDDYGKTSENDVDVN